MSPVGWLGIQPTTITGWGTACASLMDEVGGVPLIWTRPGDLSYVPAGVGLEGSTKLYTQNPQNSLRTNSP